MDFVITRETDYLEHHGIKGQKWGIRRYQNKDGSLTPEGEQRYGAKIQKLEKKAVINNSSRLAYMTGDRRTGKNYRDAVEKFEKQMSTDKTYKELSNAAAKAEWDRLYLEKKNGLENYEDTIQTKEYLDLTNKSRDAYDKKEAYLHKKEKEFLDEIKNARVKDLGITEHIDVAKKYVSDVFNSYYWDGNLEYDPDHFYEDMWD